ncbi:MAG: hypothetical protein ACW963_06805, partial [Candidatus Sifarchaeia archaeon]
MSTYKEIAQQFLNESRTADAEEGTPSRPGENIQQKFYRAVMNLRSDVYGTAFAKEDIQFLIENQSSYSPFQKAKFFMLAQGTEGEAVFNETGDGHLVKYFGSNLINSDGSVKSEMTEDEKRLFIDFFSSYNFIVTGEIPDEINTTRDPYDGEIRDKNSSEYKFLKNQFGTVFSQEFDKY